MNANVTLFLLVIIGIANPVVCYNRGKSNFRAFPTTRVLLEDYLTHPDKVSPSHPIPPHHPKQRSYEDWPEDACIDVSINADHGISSIELGDWESVALYGQRKCRGAAVLLEKSQPNCWQDDGHEALVFRCYSGLIHSVGGPKYVQKVETNPLIAILKKCNASQEWIIRSSIDNTKHVTHLHNVPFRYRVSTTMQNTNTSSNASSQAYQPGQTAKTIYQYGRTQEFGSFGTMFEQISSDTNILNTKIADMFTQKLASRFNQSSSTDFNWHEATSKTNTEDSEFVIPITILSGFKTVMYQLCGTCGPFSTCVNAIKLVTFDKFNKIYDSPLYFGNRSNGNVTFTVPASQ